MSGKSKPVRLGAVALALTAATSALAACGSGGSGAAGSRSPITVGYEVPLTGTAAADGKQEEQGWNLGLKVFGHSVRLSRVPWNFGGGPR